jgi:hypothetical protein
MAWRRILSLFVLLSCLCSCMFGSRNKKRPLRELGSVDLPARLEDRGEAALDGFVRFSFDSTSGSFFDMGSHRPVKENFVLAVWAPGKQQQAAAEVKHLAPERCSALSWRKEDRFEVAECVHTVNTRTHKAWVVFLEDAAKHASVAYMVWQDSQSLEEAKRCATQALASLQLGLPLAEYLKISGDRPAQLARERRRQFQVLLDSQGLAIQLDGPIVDKDGCFYQLWNDPREGEMFLAVCPLGELPAAKTYRVQHDSRPKGIHAWPETCWFSPDGNARKMEGGVYMSPKMEQRLTARHSDSQRSYFYAVAWDETASQVEPPASKQHEFRIALLWRALPAMQKRFAEGVLIQPIE